LGRDRLRVYESFVEEYNQNAEKEGKVPLTALDQMPTDLAGHSIVPQRDHLKEDFLDAVLRRQHQELSPGEVKELLQNPEALGQVFLRTFLSYLRTFLSKTLEVRKIRGENLNRLFDSSRRDLSTDALQLRDQLFTLLKDMQEYRRIMVEGKPAFQRRFLRVPFHQSELLAQLYPKYLQLLSTAFPTETLRQAGLQKLPSLEHLRAFSKPPSSRP
jgi:hypothetical protein